MITSQVLWCVLTFKRTGVAGLIPFHINNIEQRHTFNRYQCNLEIDKGTKIGIESKSVFIKYGHLLDPIKYMMGKYDISNTNLIQLPTLTNLDKNKINRNNNTT